MPSRHRIALSRREFLTAVAGAVVVAGASGAVVESTRHATASAGAAEVTPDLAAPTPAGSTPAVTHVAHRRPAAAPPTAEGDTTGASPPHPGPAFGSGVHVVSGLPGGPSRIAITVDDGYDSAVVGAFVRFARDSGVRLTMFPNGVYDAWTDHRADLAPLLESGQIQLGNHTWSHPRLTTLRDADVADQIRRNDAFLRRTFGIDPTPWFRPPYGVHDARTDAIAADLGYHAVTLWDGVFDDSSAHLTASQLLANARDCFAPGRIVLGHANHPPVTTVYGQLLDLIRGRHLQTVTLADVYGG